LFEISCYKHRLSDGINGIKLAAMLFFSCALDELHDLELSAVIS